jgi:hypothetical protein
MLRLSVGDLTATLSSQSTFTVFFNSPDFRLNSLGLIP